MSKVALIAVLAVVAAILIVGTLAVSVQPSGESGEAVETGPPPNPPADGSSGVVVGVNKTKSGLKLLGLTLHSPSYAAHVMLVPPPQCVVASDRGRSTVIDTGECTGLAASGEVTGGGQTADGPELVIVEVKVSEDCYAELREGDTWPSRLPACSTD